MTVKVSVITTIYNEQLSIVRLLASLATQTRLPDEVILCDGGSTDGTIALIEQYRQAHPAALPKLRLLVEPGANISRGRNVAIAAATHPIIAVTDAGVQLDPNWLAQLMAPWETAGASGPSESTGAETSVEDRMPEPVAVAGFFLPDVHGETGTERIFLTAMAATVLPLAEEIDPQKFLPSSRSIAFTKSVWQAAGGYPEWLDYCEDLIFDMAINAQAPTLPSAFVWAPAALVYFQPRGSLRTFWTQYYRYARGDGKADLWRKRHLIRYLTYLVIFPALLGHGLWGTVAPWLGWIGLLFGVIAYCARPWQRLGLLTASLAPSPAPPLSLSQRLAAALWVPLIRAIGDVAKMVGYPVGLWWRWRRRTDREIDWRQRLGESELGKSELG